MFIQLNLKYCIHHPLKDINRLTKEDQIYTSVVIKGNCLLKDAVVFPKWD